jgi:hypothetical protein
MTSIHRVFQFGKLTAAVSMTEHASMAMEPSVVVYYEVVSQCLLDGPGKLVGLRSLRMLETDIKFELLLAPEPIPPTYSSLPIP